MSLKTVFTLFLITFIAIPASSQQPQPPAPQKQEDTIRLGTSTVQLDVIVTDKAGKRITGLSASDFQILDENQPQKIDFFSAIEGSELRPGTENPEAKVAGAGGKTAGSSPLASPYQGRFIALVFDPPNITLENFNRARKSIFDYINTQIAPNDLVAMTSTTGYVGALQQFTNDKKRLISAVNRIGAQAATYESNSRDTHVTPAEAFRIDRGDRFMLDQVVRRYKAESGYQDMPVDIIERKVQTDARSVVTQYGQIVRNTIQGMANLFKTMAELPGRKVVVLMTESLYTMEGTSSDVTAELNKLSDLARRSGISVYTVDAGGLRATNTKASERVTGSQMAATNREAAASFTDFQNLGAAHTLAIATGGEVIRNTNDLAGGLQRAVEDSSTYYVLGFTPAATADNKFHQLSITVKNRPEMIVRTRRGYFAFNEETGKGTPSELAAALISPIPRTDIPVQVVANVVPRAGEQVIQTGVYVGRNYLTIPQPGAAEQKAAFDILLTVRPTWKDQLVGAVETTKTYDLAQDPQTRQRLKSEGFVTIKEFTQLEPGQYQIRAVIREKSTGMLGSAYQFFEVPDLKNHNTPALSSIVLNSPGEVGFTGRNSFKPASDIEMRYFLYNTPSGLQGLTQRVQLLDAQGKVLLDSPLALAPAQAGTDTSIAPQAGKFKLPPMRGRYSILVTLQGDKGKIDLERRADFIIE